MPGYTFKHKNNPYFNNKVLFCIQMSWTDKSYPEAPKYNTPNWREYTYGLRRNN